MRGDYPVLNCDSGSEGRNLVELEQPIDIITYLSSQSRLCLVVIFGDGRLARHRQGEFYRGLYGSGRTFRR